METVYRKIGRKYVPYGIEFHKTVLNDGLWLVQSNGKKLTSLAWLVGDLKRPCDVVTHAAIHTLENELVDYLCKLCTEDTKEVKEAKEMLGGYFREDKVVINNISKVDIVNLMLRKIAILLEESKK